MAKLGVRTIDEMVGRSDLLKVKEDAKTPMACLLYTSHPVACDRYHKSWKIKYSCDGGVVYSDTDPL